MKINSTVLEKALQSLNAVLVMERDEANIVRDSAIQRFEYTYGLAVKFIERQLENMLAIPDDVAGMSFHDLIRTAAEKDIVDNPVLWFEYRKKRNITSHTYDEAKAEEVYSILQDFAKSAGYMLERIKRLNS